MSGKSHAKVVDVDARTVGRSESIAGLVWLVVAALGGVGVVGAAGLAFMSQAGCQLQGVCAPSSAWWPGPTPTAFPNPTVALLPNSGTVDPDTWQSNGLDDPWLFFPGGRTYTIYPFVTNTAGADADRFFGPDWDFDLSVATDPQPASEGNFTPASGNIAEIFLVTDPAPDPYLAAVNLAEHDAGLFPPPPAFNVVNATCADYYLRIIVHRHPGVDSGADASAPVEVDASSDVVSDPLDAGSDE